MAKAFVVAFAHLAEWAAQASSIAAMSTPCWPGLLRTQASRRDQGIADIAQSDPVSVQGGIRCTTKCTSGTKTQADEHSAG